MAETIKKFFFLKKDGRVTPWMGLELLSPLHQLLLKKK